MYQELNKTINLFVFKFVNYLEIKAPSVFVKVKKKVAIVYTIIWHDG